MDIFHSIQRLMFPRTGKKNGGHLENNTFPSHAFPADDFRAWFVFFITQREGRELGSCNIEKRRNVALSDNQKETGKRESFYSGHAGGGIHYHRSDSVCRRLPNSDPL